MLKMLKDNTRKRYESPEVAILEATYEGIVCSSNVGSTEDFTEIEGEW